jgi:uncharacterized protein YbaP (TraB family)
LGFLRETLTEDADGTDKLNAMANHWLHHDEDALTHDVIDAAKAEDPELYKKLLVDRNVDWVPQIEDILRSRGIVFITVGAAHLLGPDGVVAQLQAAGWTVSKIE